MKWATRKAADEREEKKEPVNKSKQAAKESRLLI